MTNVFTKSTTLLMIMFFYNQIAFGMMLSTNNTWKKQWPINKLNVLSLLIFSNDGITNEIYNKVDFNDALTLRLVCKKFTQHDPILSQLASTYKNEERQIVPVCAFFDCINKKEHEKVKWFLQKKLDQPLFFVIGLSEYHVLNPHIIAGTDKEMMQLLEKYKINFCAEIERVQKKINYKNIFIKILSVNRWFELYEKYILKTKNTLADYHEKLNDPLSFNTSDILNHVTREITP